MANYFATGNRHKFREATEILAGKLEIRHLHFNHSEIRSDSLEEIATEAVNAAYAKFKKPVFVEDTGLFVDVLNGFPGTYSAWVLKKLGNTGLLKLLKGEKCRSAGFRTCIAFNDGRTVEIFTGECKGSIAKQARGESGFGYDHIFLPAGYSKTFAECAEIKHMLSHRREALLKMTSFLSRKY